MVKSDLYCSIIDEKMLEAIVAVVERNRLEILFFLGERGRKSVTEITSHFSISRPAISHHLKVLKTSGLVQSEKVGQENYYSVSISNMVDMLRNLADTLERCCPVEGGGQS